MRTGADNQPLKGVTVIDLGQIYNGPYATLLMAMAGARVIKVEPLDGENMRRRGAVGGAMVPFAMLNSNKELVSLNIKDPRGKALLEQMATSSEVILGNFAPGVMHGLGLGHDHGRADQGHEVPVDHDRRCHGREAARRLRPRDRHRGTLQ